MVKVESEQVVNVIEHCKNDSCLVCAQIGRGMAMMAGQSAQQIRQAVKNTVRGMESQ